MEVVPAYFKYCYSICLQELREIMINFHQSLGRDLNAGLVKNETRDANHLTAVSGELITDVLNGTPLFPCPARGGTKCV